MEAKCINFSTMSNDCAAVGAVNNAFLVCLKKSIKYPGRCKQDLSKIEKLRTYTDTPGII